MKMTHVERGKKGAMALNTDPVKKSEAAKKAAATKKAKNPHIFAEMGKLGAKIKKTKAGL
jgi:hypothetical protein